MKLRLNPESSYYATHGQQWLSVETRAVQMSFYVVDIGGRRIGLGDSFVAAIQNDIRPGRGYCSICGIAVRPEDELTHMYDDLSKCREAHFIPCTPENTFFIRYPNGIPPARIKAPERFGFELRQNSGPGCIQYSLPRQIGVYTCALYLAEQEGMRLLDYIELVSATKQYRLLPHPNTGKLVKIPTLWGDINKPLCKKTLAKLQRIIDPLIGNRKKEVSL